MPWEPFPRPQPKYCIYFLDTWVHDSIFSTGLGFGILVGRAQLLPVPALDKKLVSHSRCGISGDPRPAILGIVRFAIRDSVPQLHWATQAQHGPSGGAGGAAVCDSGEHCKHDDDATGPPMLRKKYHCVQHHYPTSPPLKNMTYLLAICAKALSPNRPKPTQTAKFPENPALPRNH